MKVREIEKEFKNFIDRQREYWGSLVSEVEKWLEETDPERKEDHE